MPLQPDRRSTEFESLAQRTGFSIPAIEAMRRSIVAGGGRMAQFDHPEFGGAGQWMQGGMLMISDFPDTELKARIARLCDALSQALATDPDPAPHPGEEPWYPASLGTPDSSGAQNGARYAWFGGARRLAVDDGASVTVYDTGDHRIGGVSQQQGAGRTVSFVSQHGAVDVDRLPVVDRADAPAYRTPDAPPVADVAAPTAEVSGDPYVALEKLAGLHARGIVDDDEFAAKKTELLRRI